MAETLNIALKRNEDWARTFTATDDQGQPIDLTGWSAAMQIKSRTNNSAIVATATVTIPTPTTGMIDVVVRASEGAALNAYGSPIQTENLPYDLRLTDPSGEKIDLIAGVIILTRGVTQND